MLKLCKSYGYRNISLIRPNIASSFAKDIVIVMDSYSKRAKPVIDIHKTTKIYNVAYINRVHTLEEDLVLIEYEYAKGKSFDKLLCKEVQFSEVGLINIASQLFLGLYSIHKAGYCHQEILNGNNIVINQDNLKVTILGIKGYIGNEQLYYIDIRQTAYLLLKAIARENTPSINDLRFMSQVEESMKNHKSYPSLYEVLLKVFKGELTTAFDVYKSLAYLF